MEFYQLTYFLAAAQTQNFRKAAELCLVAQSALSRQIAALEDELEVALFTRQKMWADLAENRRASAPDLAHPLRHRRRASHLAQPQLPGDGVPDARLPELELLHRAGLACAAV